MSAVTARRLAAVAMLAWAVGACEAADETTTASDPTSTSTETTVTSTTTPSTTAASIATTTTPPAPSTTEAADQPEPHPFDWQPMEATALESEQKGGGFGVVLSTSSGSWVVAGGRNDPEGVPRPAVWVSDDATAWEAVELPAPERGATVNAGAWSGDTGLLAGSMSGPQRATPGAVWLVDADGNAERVQSDSFPDDLAITEAGALPDGGFVMAGRSASEEVAFRSPNGRDWSSDSGLEEALSGLTDPTVMDIAAGPSGTLAVVVDDRGQDDLGVLLVDRGDGFEEVARLDDGADVDLNGAVVTGAQFQVYGSVRQGPAYEASIWASSDGTTWERLDASVSISEDHTSYNTYGSTFVDATRSSEGLVGIVYDAASYLFVSSGDGTSWSEVPIGDDVLDTDVPTINTIAAAGDVVVAASTGSTAPALYRVTGDSATQIVEEDLPAPWETVSITDSTTAGDRILMTTSRIRRNRDLADTPELTSRVVEVALDGTVQAGEEIVDLYAADVTATPEGDLVAVGYERFIARFLSEGTIDPKAWWGQETSELDEVSTGSPVDDTTKRIREVAAISQGLVAFGNYFPEPGTTAPIFWRSDDGSSWEEIPAPEEAETPNANPTDLCPLPTGGAMALGLYDTDAGHSPGVWVTDDGTSWDLTARSSEPFGAEEGVAFFSCAAGDERTLILGEAGAPSRGAVWETEDGSEFQRLDLPDLGDDSTWGRAAFGPDGTLYLLGSRLREGAREYVLVTVEPDGSIAGPHSLRIDPFLGPTGPASLGDLHVVEGRLVMLGHVSGSIRIWSAPIE